MRAVLSHSAPAGREPDPELKHEAHIRYVTSHIADVEWYAPVPAKHAAAKRSREVLGCPIFKKHTPDHRAGTFWPVESHTVSPRQLVQSSLVKHAARTTGMPDSTSTTLQYTPAFSVDDPEHAAHRDTASPSVPIGSLS